MTSVSMGAPSTYLDAVGGPTAQLRRGVNIFLKLRSKFRQINVQMACQTQHRRCASELAFGVQQFRWVQ